MARWHDLETHDRELASIARRLLTVPGVGFGYLATVALDGSPRIHPVNPLWIDGDLAVFVVPSPKLHDLRRDGRYALHSTGAEGVDDELCVFGRATFPEDAALRARAVAAYHGPVADDHVLALLRIDKVLWSHFTSPPTWPPTYRVWRARH